MVICGDDDDGDDNDDDDDKGDDDDDKGRQVWIIHSGANYRQQ